MDTGDTFCGVSKEDGRLECCSMETNSQIKTRKDTFFTQNKRSSTRSNARQYTSIPKFLQALNIRTKSHML